MYFDFSTKILQKSLIKLKYDLDGRVLLFEIVFRDIKENQDAIEMINKRTELTSKKEDTRIRFGR